MPRQIPDELKARIAAATAHVNAERIARDAAERAAIEYVPPQPATPKGDG